MHRHLLALGLGLGMVLASGVLAAGTPTQLIKYAGDAQTVTAGTAVPLLVCAIVKDASDVPVPGVTVNFGSITGGGSITGAVAITDSGGIATLGSWTLGAVPGPNSLTATSGALTPITFTATGTAPITPAISSVLSATVPVNVPFTYTITASGTTPLTFGATGLPAGLTINGAVISGTPTVSGTFPVTISASNQAGSDSKTLQLSIYINSGSGGTGGGGSALPPAISSQPTVSASVAAPGDVLTFTVSATDPSGLLLTYTWNFGDGTQATGGASITHSYAAAGNFLAAVTASNGITSTASTSVPVEVVSARIDLGMIDLNKTRGKVALTIAIPTGFPKHGVKSTLVDGSAGTGVKYSNLKLRGKADAAASFSFVIEFSTRKPPVTERIIYTYAVTK